MILYIHGFGGSGMGQKATIIKEKLDNHQPEFDNLLLLTQTGDELLDYKVGVEYLSGAKQIVVEGGDHSFVGIENYIDEMVRFFDA